MSKPSPIDALCERWRVEARSRERLLNPWGYIPTVRETMAGELSRLAPLVAKAIEEGEHAAFERHVSWGATGNIHCAENVFDKCKNPACQMFRAALKAYEEGK